MSKLKTLLIYVFSGTILVLLMDLISNYLLNNYSGAVDFLIATWFLLPINAVAIGIWLAIKKERLKGLLVAIYILILSVTWLGFLFQTPTCTIDVQNALDCSYQRTPLGS